MLSRISIIVFMGVVSSLHAQELGEMYRTSPRYDLPSAYGQLVQEDSPSPLPPVDDEPRTRAQLASFPHEMTEPLLGDPNNPILLPQVDQPLQFDQSQFEQPQLQMPKPPGREGVFQKASFVTTYLPRLDGTGVGFLGLDVSAVFGFPFPKRESPLLIMPGTEVNFVEASTAYDLPSELYDNYVQFRYLRKIGDRWGMDIAVTPGWHSDYQNNNGDDCYRTVGYGVGAYDWTPRLKVALGVAYLDRDDVNILPAGGFVWTPNDWTRLELIAPRPRLAWRFGCDRCCEDWVFLAGEFGGGQWGIQRAGDVNDVLTVRDYRLIGGIERKSLVQGVNARAELGYVFGRELEYRSGIGDESLPDTMMARVGVSY